MRQVNGTDTESERLPNGDVYEGSYEHGKRHGQVRIGDLNGKCFPDLMLY